MGEMFWHWLAAVVVILLGTYLGARKHALTSAQIETAKDFIWNRYNHTETIQDERAVGYAHREIDRQINKVRGILTFDGILLVVFRLDFDHSAHPWATPLSAAALVFVAISVAICLTIFFVRWGNVASYEKFSEEFAFKIRVVGERTWLVNWAVMLSACSAAAVASVVVLLKFLPHT